MTHATKHLYFAAFILAQIEINLSILQLDVDLLVKNIIGEDAWALLSEPEKLTVGSEFAYMAKHKLIPFERVGTTSSNWAIYHMV